MGMDEEATVINPNIFERADAEIERWTAIRHELERFAKAAAQHGAAAVFGDDVTLAGAHFQNLWVAEARLEAPVRSTDFRLTYTSWKRGKQRLNTLKAHEGFAEAVNRAAWGDDAPASLQ